MLVKNKRGYYKPHWCEYVCGRSIGAGQGLNSRIAVEN